jgi:sugar/nucleoside kinase (ribokinase family)
MIFMNRKESVQASSIAKATTGWLGGDFPHIKWIVTNEDQPTEVTHAGAMVSYSVTPVECRVSVGGGDAFAAGVCAGDLRGWLEKDAVRLGHALAGRVVSQLGCQLPAKVVHQLAEEGDFAVGPRRVSR